VDKPFYNHGVFYFTFGMAYVRKIPKIIHYVWVGPKTLNNQNFFQRCRDSWSFFLPDYELKLWSERNSPMDHRYVKEMYGQKKWAFVSDYIRFWALYHEGGIYLDTDMEILKSLDSFLRHEVFFGKTKDGFIGCGIIGASPRHEFIKEVLQFYNNDMHFSIKNTSPKVVTKIFLQSTFSGINVYDSSYFYPHDDGERGKQNKDAFTTHHWSESWVPFSYVRKFLRRIGIMSYIKRFF